MLMPPAAFIVHTLPQAKAAAQAGAEAGRALLLHSAANAAATLGAEGWLALLQAVRSDHPDAQILEGFLDCGRAPGLAMAALRIGLRRLTLLPDCPSWSRISDITRQMGGELSADPPRDALDLSQPRDPLAAARMWVEG